MWADDFVPLDLGANTGDWLTQFAFIFSLLYGNSQRERMLLRECFEKLINEISIYIGEVINIDVIIVLIYSPSGDWIIYINAMQKCLEFTK
jgi:hypothetical protein